MKAILYSKGGRENAAYTDVPDPVVGENDVLVRVYASYICRPADCAHDGGYSVFGKYPLIPGHEWSGIVEGVGEKVTRFKAGDRVTADANFPCGECYFCKRGEFVYCENNHPYGQHKNGGFAQLIAIDQSLVYKIPDGVTLRNAAMTELAACVYQCMTECDFHYGDDVLVIGAGASGTLISQMAKSSNAAHVVAIDCVQSKLDRLEKKGIETVLVDKEDYSKHEATLKERYPYGFDVVIDATSDAKLITRSIELVKKGGKFIGYAFVNNTSADDPVEINTRMFVTRGIRFIGSPLQHYKFDEVLNSMAAGKMNCEEMITKVLPLENFFEGMDAVWNDLNTVKVLLEPNGSSEGM